MERIKDLGRYQKGVLFFMTAMILVFATAYSVTVNREGFAYRDEILIPSQEQDLVTYSGKIQGQQALFTVHADKTVEFQYGEKTYGPYRAKEDPTAIPEDSEFGEYITGVELHEGEELFFRGGIVDHGGYIFLYSEDGEMENMESSIVFSTDAGIIMDENGIVIDPMKPSAYTILELMAGSELTHKGDWTAWFGGVIICIVTAVSILYADEIFRWNLAFQIRNADQAEPSDWEMAGRYIGWTLLPFAAMILFITGLK